MYTVPGFFFGKGGGLGGGCFIFGLRLILRGQDGEEERGRLSIDQSIRNPSH